MAAFGVVVEVTTNSKRAAREIRGLLERGIPSCIFLKTEASTGQRFRYVWNASGRDTLYKNGDVLAKRVKRADLLDALVSSVRIAVAEFAVDRVFIHAGVVGWKGKAIVIPAKSFQGKSTLTAELVRLGARYYSDEYAVLDKRGLVHPFAKPLSLRGVVDHYKQVPYSAEALGGKSGRRPIPVGLVLITEYKKNAIWRPKPLSPGAGMIELIKNTVPIRSRPRFTLGVLSGIAESATIIKSTRGEAQITAEYVIDFLDQRLRSAKQRNFPSRD